MFRVFRWLSRFTAFFQTSLVKDEVDDDLYEQNKPWIAVTLHAFYLIFFVTCLLYYALCFPILNSRKWLIRLFFPVSAACSIISLICFAKFGWVRVLYWTLVLYGLVYPYLMWWSHGSYMGTPGYCWNWLLLSSILTLLLIAARPAVAVLFLQILTPIAGGLMDRYGARHQLDIHCLLEHAVQIVIPTCTLFLLTFFLGQVAAHSRKQAALKHELGQMLLRNVLPMSVADRLVTELAVSSEVHIAEEHAMATVCFCDIVGFTQLSLEIDPSELVRTLNKIFSHFDRLCISYGVEKIKTIGDAYMFAGFPTDNPPDSAVTVIEIALQMLVQISDFALNGKSLKIRAGAHSGPLVAGVIGCTKFAYDVWGPTVNLASRLESSGLPGEIQVSSSTKNLIKGSFNCVFRDTLHLKGAGRHDVFLVKKSNFAPSNLSFTNAERGGLSDMSKLVREIKRRQTTCIFPDSRVKPMAEPSNISVCATSPSRNISRVPVNAEEPVQTPNFHAVSFGPRDPESEEDTEAPSSSKMMSSAFAFGENSMLFGRMVLPSAVDNAPLPSLLEHADDDDMGMKSSTGLRFRTPKEHSPHKEATPMNPAGSIPATSSRDEFSKEDHPRRQSGVLPPLDPQSRRRNSGARRSSLLVNYPFLDRDLADARGNLMEQHGTSMLFNMDETSPCTLHMSQDAAFRLSPASPSSPTVPCLTQLQFPPQCPPRTRSMDSFADPGPFATFDGSRSLGILGIADAAPGAQVAHGSSPHALLSSMMTPQKLPALLRPQRAFRPLPPSGTRNGSNTSGNLSPTPCQKQSSSDLRSHATSSKTPDAWHERLLPPYMKTPPSPL